MIINNPVHEVSTSTPTQPTSASQQQAPLLYTSTSGVLTDSQIVKPFASAYQAFLYFVQFWALGSVAWGVGAILFQVITKAFPETLDRGYGLTSYLSLVDQYVFKYAIASLIVAGPIYFGLSVIITRSVSRGNIHPASRARMWISYLVLFIVTAIMIGDLISLLYFYLGGELVTRTVLKGLAVLFIAGFIFCYYFVDLRRELSARWGRLFQLVSLGVAVITALTVLLVGFFNIDGPNTTRYKQADQKTMSNIMSTQAQIDSYAAKNFKLPESLDDLKQNNGGLGGYSAYVLDSWKGLTYTKKSATTYSLCGVFKRSNKADKKEDRDAMAMNYALIPNTGGEEWQHDEGKACFEKAVISLSQGPNSWNAATPMQPYGSTQLDSPSWLLAGKNIPGTSDPKSEIRAAAYSMQAASVLCADQSEVISGAGGGALCRVGTAAWKNLSQHCGSTQWVVKNGSERNWDFTLMCPNYLGCSGPENLLCTQDSCVFSLSC